MKGLFVILGNYLGKHFKYLKGFLGKHFTDFKEFIGKHWKAALAVLGFGVSASQLLMSYGEFSDLYSDVSSRFKGIASFLPMETALNTLSNAIDVSAVSNASFAEIINAFGFISAINILINGLGIALGEVIFIWLIKSVSHLALEKGLKEMLVRFPKGGIK